MSKALAKASKLKPEIRLAQAISEFEASLSTDEKGKLGELKTELVSASPPDLADVMRLTAEIDQIAAKSSKGRRCFGPRFTRFLEGVQRYVALGDLLVTTASGGKHAENLFIARSVWMVFRMSLMVKI